MYSKLLKICSAATMVFQLIACGGGGSNPAPLAPSATNNSPPVVSNPPPAATPTTPVAPVASSPVTVPCGSGTFAPLGYTSPAQCKIGLTVLPKNVQMLHPGELRFKFSDVDGNERTRTFTYSNGQTGTAVLTYMAGSLGEQVAGTSVTLETPSSKNTYTAFPRGSSAFSVEIPASSALSFNTNYTLTLSGFSPYWNADAIVIDAKQVLSFKTADAAFSPPQTCGVHGNAPCLLTPALCTWDSPCVLGIEKKNYYFENPANTLTFGLLENNYLGTASSGRELVFRATGLSVGGGYYLDGTTWIRSNVGQRVSTVRFSRRGDIYFDYASAAGVGEYCSRVGWSAHSAWSGQSVDRSHGSCASLIEPTLGDWIVPAGHRIDRTCTLAQRCAIGIGEHYVNDRATNDSINGDGWVFSRSFVLESAFPGAFQFRRYWLDLGPKPSPFTAAPTDPKTSEINKLGKAKNAFWVSDDLYVETDSGTCFHVNRSTFTVCPI
jgi:hypothetical protein